MQFEVKRLEIQKAHHVTAKKSLRKNNDKENMNFAKSENSSREYS
jgi:hypothetical protein